MKSQDIVIHKRAIDGLVAKPLTQSILLFEKAQKNNDKISFEARLNMYHTIALSTSVTILGHYCKFLAKIFIGKVAQIFSDSGLF